MCIRDSIKDSHNLLANYVPTSATGLVQVGQGLSAPYPTNYNNISPRVGFAFDIFGNGKTVLRGGAGLIYEQPSIRTFMFNGGGLNLNPSGLVGSGSITSFLIDSEDTSLLNGERETRTRPCFLLRPMLHARRVSHATFSGSISI